MTELAVLSEMLLISLAAAYGYVYLLYRRPLFLWLSCAWLLTAGSAIPGALAGGEHNPYLRASMTLAQMAAATCLVSAFTILNGWRNRATMLVATSLMTAAGFVAVAHLGKAAGARIASVTVIISASSFFLLAIRFLLVSNADLLLMLRASPLITPQPGDVHTGSPTLSRYDLRRAADDRQLSTIRRLFVATYCLFGLAELVWLVQPRWLLSPNIVLLLFYIGILAKMLHGIALAAWILIDFRIFSEILRERSLAAELGVLTASIEHDVKNPLSILQRDIDTALKQHASNRPLVNHLKRMLRSVARIRTAVGVVPIVRDAAEDFERSATVINIVAVVRDAIVAVKRADVADNVRFRFDTPRNEFHILGDRDRLIQALINIFNNAIEATRGVHDRTPFIVIRCVHDRDRRSITVSVRDNGGGISPDLVGRLGRPFSSTKQDGGGNRGIGLFITTRIIRMHHGDISFGTDSRSFTEVNITLPLIRNSALTA